MSEWILSHGFLPWKLIRVVDGTPALLTVCPVCCQVNGITWLAPHGEDLSVVWNRDPLWPSVHPAIIQTNAVIHCTMRVAVQDGWIWDEGTPNHALPPKPTAHHPG